MHNEDTTVWGGLDGGGGDVSSDNLENVIRKIMFFNFFKKIRKIILVNFLQKIFRSIKIIFRFD